MDLDREDATSLQVGSSDVASEAAGGVTVMDSSLAVPDENKNGESNASSESGLEVDRASVGHGSGGSDGEREIDPTEMVSFENCMSIHTVFLRANDQQGMSLS